MRKSYDDVFYVVGALYFINTVIFGAIPLMDRYRRSRKKLDYNEIAGAVDQHKQTFRIIKRSVSGNSVGNTEETEAPQTKLNSQEIPYKYGTANENGFYNQFN